MESTEQGADTLVADLLEAAGGSEATPETDTATPATDQSPTPDTPPVQPDATSPEKVDAPATPAPLTPPEIPTPVDPFSGGEPFAFRIDGRQVSIDGAKVINDHVVIPKSAWLNQMQHFLGDRSAIRNREGQYKQALEQANAGRSEWEAEKATMLGEIQQMFADPEAMLAKLQNWQTEGPLLMAKMEAKAARQQVEQFQRRQQDEMRHQQEAAVIPQLQDQLGDTVEQWLSDHGINWESDKERWSGWMRNVWEDFGPNGLFQRDPISGRPVLQEDKVQRLFQREVSRVQSAQVAAKAVEQKKAMNAAAVAPSKPKPPVPGKAPAPAPTRARNDSGQYTKKDEPFDRDTWLAKRSYLDEE